MAHVDREKAFVLPRIAASAVNYGAPVRTSASAANEVVPVATANVPVLGIAVATAATYQTGVAVQQNGIAICRAAASIGVGALVAVATSTGRLYPASTGQETVGESQQAAADGDYFSVLLKPRAPVA